MSQRRSVASRNARPSSTWVSTRGSSYGRSGWVLPTSSRCSSISTASTDVAPRARATATSLPEPAPMISTSPGDWAVNRSYTVSYSGLPTAAELQPRGNSVDLGDDAAGVADRCGVHFVVGRPGRIRFRRLHAERDNERYQGNDDDGDRGTLPRTNGHEQSSGRDRPPHHRLGVEERQHGEGDDAEQAADEIELVGVEVARGGRTNGPHRHRGRPSRPPQRRRPPAARPSGAGRRCRGRRRSGRPRRCRPARRGGRSARRGRRASPGRSRTANVTPGHRPDPSGGSPTGIRRRCRGSCRAARCSRSRRGTRRWRRASGSGRARRTASEKAVRTSWAGSASRHLGLLPLLRVSV